VLLLVFLLGTLPIADHPAVTRAAIPIVWGYGALSYLELAVHLRLCPLCAAQVPLNPSELAVAKDRQLRWYHWTTSGPRWRAPGICIAVGNLIAIVAVNLWQPTPEWFRHIIYAVTLGGWGTAMFVTSRTHSKLEPWCPYCRRDDGEDEPTVAPQPVPTAQVSA
jgi:hypothetical protein